MQNLLLTVDRLSTWIGKVFAWAIVGLTLMVTWEVFSRYILNKPHSWMFDVQIMLYGTLFMTAGAYTLAKNGHVRGDVLYGFFQPRTQATVGLTPFWVGMAKAPIFAFLIAVIGCLEGFRVQGSAQSVGEHTTSAVVQSIFVVIVVDAIAALFCMEMGW